MTAEPPQEHPTRTAMVAVVRERRGLHKSELARLVGIGWGNCSHHLRVLERVGLVHLEGRGRLTWVFDPAVPRSERDLLVVTRATVAQRLLHALGMRDRVTVGSLSEELELSKKVIRKHLGNLARAGAVERSRGHPPSFAKAPPRGADDPECPLDRLDRLDKRQRF